MILLFYLKGTERLYDVGCGFNMIIADRCEKTSLINLAVLFCKVDFE